jgi:sarcosine oxidase delta subunit
MRPIGAAPRTVCWHCARPIDFAADAQAARYLYRGDQPLTVVVEDWMRCTCGAYQNIRRLTEITVEALGKS